MRPPLTPQTTSPATLRPTTRAFKLANEPVLVLEGSGVLEVEGESVPVAEGTAVFVEAGAEHLFTAYEQLSVLVILDRRAAGNP
jgi:mannose-6-phosphate isomerase-like protein (cupin superfamily)